MSEMSESRTSLNAGAGAANDPYGATGLAGDSHMGPDQHVNPFKEPKDDRIFTFKDEERTRKEHER